MYKKYLSIITNFGCHYTCPYCIVKNNQIDIPETTIKGLNNLRQAIIGYGCNIVSISGGGEPLYEYEQHKDWYDKLFLILDEMDIPMEMHTSCIQNDFPTNECKRVVYHLNSSRQLREIRRKGKEVVRAVFVVTEDMTEEYLHIIADYVKEDRDIDELSFRQQVGENYETKYFLHDILLAGHRKDWFYIQQHDYNLYYAENKVYTRYKDFQKIKESEDSK